MTAARKAKSLAKPKAKPLESSPPRSSAKSPSTATSTMLATLKAKSKQARRQRQLDKRRLRDLLALVRRRLGEIVEAFYDIGDALEEVTRKELYRTEGIVSFDLWLKKHELMSDVQARKFVAIAQGMSRENALSAGPERAYELVRLAAEDPAIKSADALTHPDATVEGKLVKDMTVEDIAALRRARREKSGDQPAANPERVQQNEAASKLQSVLRNEGAAGALVRAVHKGKHWAFELELRADDAVRLHLSKVAKKATKKPAAKRKPAAKKR